jgi:tripartite-type tricarboxylate transporter receptor subunit TctC
MIKRLAMAVALNAWILSGANAAGADEFPNRPIKIVYPWGPGGLTDDLARTIAEGLTARLKQPVVIEYKPGATTIVAASYVARAPADGYTLLYGSAPTFAVNVSTHKNLSYDPVKDFAPVSRLITTPFFVAASNSLPVKSLADLVALARERPGQISYSTPGIGSVPHLSIERFAQQSGIKLIHTPYNGIGKQIGDLVAGHVDFTFHSQVFQNLQAGQLRGLAYTGTHRPKALPSLPTVSETVLPGYSAAVWFALAAPAGTPRDVIDKLNAAIRDTLAQPAVVARFAEQAIDIDTSTPDELRDQIVREIPQWRDVIKAAGIDLEQ